MRVSSPFLCGYRSLSGRPEEGRLFPDTISQMQLILDALAMPWDVMAEKLLLCDPVWNTPGSAYYS